MNNRGRKIRINKQKVMITAVTIGSAIVGYKVGVKVTRTYFAVGLAQMFKIDPELGPRMLRVSKKL